MRAWSLLFWAFYERAEESKEHKTTPTPSRNFLKPLELHIKIYPGFIVPEKGKQPLLWLGPRQCPLNGSFATSLSKVASEIIALNVCISFPRSDNPFWLLQPTDLWINSAEWKRQGQLWCQERALNSRCAFAWPFTQEQGSVHIQELD